MLVLPVEFRAATSTSLSLHRSLHSGRGRSRREGAALRWHGEEAAGRLRLLREREGHPQQDPGKPGHAHRNGCEHLSSLADECEGRQGRRRDDNARALSSIGQQGSAGLHMTNRPSLFSDTVSVPDSEVHRTNRRSLSIMYVAASSTRRAAWHVA